MPFNYPHPLEIVEITQETPDIKRFVLRSKEIAHEAKPLQYVLATPITVRDEGPFSISDVNSDCFELAIKRIEGSAKEPGKIVGECTRALHEKKVGDCVGVKGPYGNTLDFKGRHLTIFVGGYAAAAVPYLARTLIEEGNEVTVAIGGKTKQDLLFYDRFRKLGCSMHAATEDGSFGERGFVTVLLPELFAQNVDAVLAIGPELMMKAVVDEAEKRGIPSFASPERYIKCGRGICGCCAIGSHNTCGEGHILSGKELLQTEFGHWTRERDGTRIPFVSGGDVSSRFLEPVKVVRYPMLEMTVAGVKYRNPFTNGSGAGYASQTSIRYGNAGAGAVLLKSQGAERRLGHNGPVFLEKNEGELINSMGLPGAGIGPDNGNDYSIEVQETVRATHDAGVVVIGSLYGKGIEGEHSYPAVAKRYEKLGVKKVELNLSCPNTKEGNVEESMADTVAIIKAVKSAVAIPVFVKFSPNIPNVIDMCKAAEEAGADGLTLINTEKRTPVYTSHGFEGIPMVSNPAGIGGASWAAIAEKSKAILKEAYNEVKIPIFSAGGIHWDNIVERFLLGASGCQMASVFAYAAPEQVFGNCINRLHEYLRMNKYENIREIIGTGNKR